MEQQLFFFNYPKELQEKILNSVKCEKTILACRKTCKTFWKFFNVVNVYCEGFIIGRNYFSPEMFTYKDLEGNIIRNIIFQNYNRWKYEEFTPNGNLIRCIKSKKLLTTETTDFSDDYFIKIINMDSRYGNIEEKKIHKFLQGPCTIS